MRVQFEAKHNIEDSTGYHRLGEIELSIDLYYIGDNPKSIQSLVNAREELRVMFSTVDTELKYMIGDRTPEDET